LSCRDLPVAVVWSNGIDRRSFSRSEIPPTFCPEATAARSRGGDFDALVALLDPDVVLRSDFGAKHRAASVVIRGAAAVAKQARGFPGALVRPALVNGAAGAIITVRARPFAVMA